MEDKEIVALYWERSELAIQETQKKYGRYCRYIAMNILHSEEDAEECVNDTYIKAWEIIPPNKPELLSAFLGKLTRNIAINRLAHDGAQKRSPALESILDETVEFSPKGDSVEDGIHLRDTINAFVESLPQETRVIFIRRYWYMSSVKDIARDHGLSESKVKVTLMRTRRKFKAFLEKEGIAI